MEFSKLAEYFEKLEKTPARLEMTAVLAEVFQAATASEIDKICFLSLGRLGPLYDNLEFSLADRMMVRVLSRAYGVTEAAVTADYKRLGDLGDTGQNLATQRHRTGNTETQKLIGSNPKGLDPWGDGTEAQKKGRLTVGEVYQRLTEIAAAAGTGSQERKINLLSDLLKSLDGLSSKYVIRIPLGKMRLGFSDKTLIEALSWLSQGDKSLKAEIEKAYFVYPNIGEIARRFKAGGISALEKIIPVPGVPLLPQLCQRVPTAVEILEKVGDENGAVIIEPKYDGTRVQLHLDKDQRSKIPAKGGGKSQNLEMDLGGYKTPQFLVKTFTRNLEETTAMFPDLVAGAIKQIAAESVILDGEAVGFDPKTGKMLPFQETVQRKRKYDVSAKAVEIPLKLHLFDVLYLDGRNLMSRPFCERRKILERVIKDGDVLKVTVQEKIDRANVLESRLKRAQKEGWEGLVVKSPSAPYAAGSRGFAWVKFKQEEGGEGGSSRLADTIDAVVLGYDKGEGKRVSFGIGAFLVGVYDRDNDRFLTVAKIGTGLTDEQWEELKIKAQKSKIKEIPKNVEIPESLMPDVLVEPKMVAVIKADEITKSPVHSSGLALRFPRLVAWREDKTAEQVTTVKELQAMFKGQKR